MKLISNNIKIKPNTRLSNRTHETLFVIFILFWLNLLNCECFWQLNLSRKQTFSLFMFTQTFSVRVVEISNKHFCKLDRILRNFPSWQFFCICDSLRDLWIWNLLFYAMRLRYFRTLLYSKSHRVAILLNITQYHTALLLQVRKWIWVAQVRKILSIFVVWLGRFAPFAK